ncbi:MAG: SPOR domain-containing protein [Chloroflexia bacterium]|nr:SPOR domain-containing protein [Chloroflexia bacterium]
MLGTFGKISVAREEEEKVKKMGFKDAYVTAYYDGQHISLDKAKRVEKQQFGTVTNNTTVSNNSTISNNLAAGDIVFMVQVGAYSQVLSNADENNLKSKFAPRNVNRKFASGMNVYAIGNYKTYKEADYLKKKLLGEGHQGVFVVAFEGDNKIPVGEAIKKQN